tara:strand:+ start:228 stop:1040 length:813 start_codon:yes stop_codon:yes gene_type:complete
MNQLDGECKENQNTNHDEDEDNYSDHEDQKNKESKLNDPKSNTVTTAVSSGISHGGSGLAVQNLPKSQNFETSISIQKSKQLASKLQKQDTDQELGEDDEEESEEASSPECTSPERLDKLGIGIKPFKIEGIVPKDIEQKKEMMSFIGYPSHIENACKYLSCNKLMTFNEGPHDKNRIFISGNSIMSTKLTVSLAMSAKLCSQLRESSIFEHKIKRNHVLEKQSRASVNIKMKQKLQDVIELQNKYVDLSEFKKFSCINIDTLVPLVKVS